MRYGWKSLMKHGWNMDDILDEFFSWTTDEHLNEAWIEP
jgi:hypothetical protein